MSRASSIDRLPSGKWRGRYYDETGTRRSKTFEKHRPAKDWLHAQRVSVASGQHVDPTDRTTVSEYALRWHSARGGRPSTVRTREGLIRNSIERTSLGARPLGRVKPLDVQGWATERADALSPSTLRNVVSLLRSIYASAVADRLVASSPVLGWRSMSLPSADRARIVPLTVGQVAALADAMPGRNRAMVITQAGLGLRIGELLALRVQDVDFLGRTARVEFQIAPGAKTRSAPKTPLSRRTIPLPRVVADELARHIRDCPPGADGSLFTTRTGAVYRHDYYGSQIFARAVERAGLPKGTTSHSLRHHYASVLVAAGESVFAVAERLGHRNPNLVLSTYAHLMPDSEEGTRRAIDSAWVISGAQEARSGRLTAL